MDAHQWGIPTAASDLVSLHGALSRPLCRGQRALSGRQEQFLWKLALAIPFLQLPLALWQTLTLGLSDPDLIQGSFVGMGAGHHVAGGIALMGGSICVAKGILALSFRERVLWLLSGLSLMSDSNFIGRQAKHHGLPSSIRLPLMTLRGGQGNFSRGQWTGLAVTLPTLALAIYAAFIFIPHCKWLSIGI